MLVPPHLASVGSPLFPFVDEEQLCVDQEPPPIGKDPPSFGDDPTSVDQKPPSVDGEKRKLLIERTANC